MLRLGRFFRTSGEFWLSLQKLYELRRAERKNGAAIARLPSLDDTDRPRAAGWGGIVDATNGQGARSPLRNAR